MWLEDRIFRDDLENLMEPNHIVRRTRSLLMETEKTHNGSMRELEKTFGTGCLKEIFQEDMESICNAPFLPWDRLKGSTILITGATGLIGYNLVNALLYADMEKYLQLNVVALVRDTKRAESRFEDSFRMLREVGGGENAADASSKFSDSLRFIEGNVEDVLALNGNVDYIIHGASQTASRAFVSQPVETILTALHGTENMLELAREKHTKGMVYLSSMEVYGSPQKGHKITEQEIGRLLPQEPRSSYPISKIQCEALCSAYATEYGVPAMTVRLAQTFGFGVNYNDTRIFAEFGRCIREKRDIVLTTKGETERSYLYTADAVTAILTVMLKGTPGEAYNAADEGTYCSIREMAEQAAGLGGIDVRFEPRDIRESGFPETLYMDMNTEKLRKLGWTPGGYVNGMTWMFERMLGNFQFI